MIKFEPMATSEVASTLAVSRPTVHRMARDGRLVPIKHLPGRTGALLFDREEVMRLRGQRAADAAQLVADLSGEGA